MTVSAACTLLIPYKNEVQGESEKGRLLPINDYLSLTLDLNKKKYKKQMKNFPS